MILETEKLEDSRLRSGIIVILFGIVSLGIMGLFQDAYAENRIFTEDTTLTTGQRIEVGETWVINSDVSLTLVVDVTIKGNIENHGNIFLTGIIYNEGNIDNRGTIQIKYIYPSILDPLILNDGTINNSGSIDNLGIITNYNTINNSGSFDNSGNIDHPFENSIVENYGIINNSGSVWNNNFFYNFNTINNSGTIENDSFLPNSGTINDYCGIFIGTIPSFGNPIVDKCTSFDLIEKLTSDIESEDFANTVENSLLGPLKKVVKILDDDNPDNDDAVCDKLEEFIANVESKEVSGKLDSYLANSFINSAEKLRDEIGCQ